MQNSLNPQINADKRGCFAEGVSSMMAAPFMAQRSRIISMGVEHLRSSAFICGSKAF
jgi:hypothetical protein